MSKYLFIDTKLSPSDVTWTWLPKHNYKIIRTFEEFVNTIRSSGLPEFFSLDDAIGMDCAKWICEHCTKLNANMPSHIVHTRNQGKGKKIANVLAAYIFNKNDTKKFN
jgi:hypothetical protein